MLFTYHWPANDFPPWIPSNLPFPINPQFYSCNVIFTCFLVICCTPGTTKLQWRCLFWFMQGDQFASFYPQTPACPGKHRDGSLIVRRAARTSTTQQQPYSCLEFSTATIQCRVLHNAPLCVSTCCLEQVFQLNRRRDHMFWPRGSMLATNVDACSEAQNLTKN